MRTVARRSFDTRLAAWNASPVLHNPPAATIALLRLIQIEILAIVGDCQLDLAVANDEFNADMPGVGI